MTERRSGLGLSPERLALLRQMRGQAGLAAAEAIPRRGGDGPAPLSPGQRRLWLAEQARPGTALYTIPWLLRLRGPLDEGALRRALDALAARHEPLRTRFPVPGGEPVQEIAPAGPFPLATADVEGEDADGREARVERLLREEARRPWDLARGPLARGLLVRVAGDDHRLLLALHHAVADGASLGVLLRELAALYASSVRGEPSPLAPLPLSYADYAAWERGEARTRARAKALEYWRGRLAGAPPVLPLQTDAPRPPRITHRGANHAFPLPPELDQALRGFARDERTTLFATLLAAFLVVLRRYTGTDDLVVGTPVAGRERPELEGLAGFFANTVALRVDLSGDPTLRELLDRVGAALAAAHTHQHAPFEEVVEAAGVQRVPGCPPLVQAAFMLNEEPPAARAGGVVFESGSVDTSTAKWDLTVSMDVRPGRLDGWMEYAADLFHPATMEGIARHYRVLLHAVAAGGAERRISALPLMDGAERARVLELGVGVRTAYPRTRTIHGLFREQAARTPDAPAVEFAGRVTTYRALDAWSDRLAARLCARGVGVEVRVGVAAEPSAAMAAALLGVLKAGGAYLPLDPAYPSARLGHMLRDAGAALVLATPALAARLPEHGLPTLLLDDAGEDDGDADEFPSAAVRTAAVVEDGAGADGLAYVMYTSGSTGAPKGICVPHRGVVRLVVGTDYVRLGPGDRIGQVSNLSFDAATFEIWGALLTGATLVGIGREELLSPGALAAALRRERVTSAFFTAPLFRQTVRAVPDAFATMRDLLVGGDAVDGGAVRAALAAGPPARLLNGYGPTENTTFSAWHAITRPPQEGAGVPIGAPLANSTAFVLDGRMDAVPAGVPGELFLGGDGLARGYQGRPALTAERFVPHPFAAAPGERLYRTGDRARWNHRGELEFLGRADAQVKIRGFRIEPAEVEAALLALPGVAQAAVVVREAEGGRELAAYVAGAGARPDAAALRERLREELPAFMLPAHLVALDALPLNANGKVDRAALPDPAHAAAPAAQAPRTDAERVLCDAWAEVLGVGAVGVRDGFFELGGHSLRAAQLVSRVRELFGVEVGLAGLLSGQTPAQMLDEVAAALGGRATAEEIAGVHLLVAGMDEAERLALLGETEVGA